MLGVFEDDRVLVFDHFVEGSGSELSISTGNILFVPPTFYYLTDIILILFRPHSIISLTTFYF